MEGTLAAYHAFFPLGAKAIHLKKSSDDHNEKLVRKDCAGHCENKEEEAGSASIFPPLALEKRPEVGERR